MCGDSADSDLAASGEISGADLHRRDGEALTWDDGICPDSVDGSGRVYEHGVSVSAFLTLVKGTESLVDGVGLRAEDLLVRAEVVTLASPPP